MSQATSIHRETATRRMLDRIALLLPRFDTARLAYGVKLALALLIAVWVELWFDLGMADSAAICVLVVKSNILGTTVQKSILRMIGNLIGCTIGLVLHCSVCPGSRHGDRCFLPVQRILLLLSSTQSLCSRLALDLRLRGHRIRISPR